MGLVVVLLRLLGGGVLIQFEDMEDSTLWRLSIMEAQHPESKVFHSIIKTIIQVNASIYHERQLSPR